MANKKKNSTDYFSLDNLDNLVHIDDHLCFIDNLANKYENATLNKEKQNAKNRTGELDWGQIRQQMDLIRKKKKDKKLNLSIIGEFSTGKSTFINALLGKELLASSALQGTTVASTIIDYSKNYGIVIEFLNGRKKKVIEYADFSKLKTALAQYTTDPNTAKQLKTVSVYLPSEILKNFRIIDTPGTNVTEAWHEEVTVRTLKNDSDLSIILVSGEKLVTNTMLQFVEKNIKDILPQCIFVITKLDMLRQREREPQVVFIKKKLEDELELEHAVVLPYISPSVLSDKQSGRDCTKLPEAAVYKMSYNDDSLLGISYQTERLLIQHTAKQKSLAITRKLVQLIDSIYKMISATMEQISLEYENKIALLNRSKRVDLSFFVSREKNIRLKHFDNKMRDLEAGLEEEIDSNACRAKNNVLEKLDKKGSLEQLKAYITDSLGGDCIREARRMIGDANLYYMRIRNIFGEEMEQYGDSFSGVYQSLEIIPVDMSQTKFDLPGDIEIETANITSTATYIADQLAKENRSVFGGMAAGAAIGTAIAPGIGTLVGAIWGGFIGGASAPDTGKVREACKEKLNPQLQTYYSSIENELLSAVEEYAGKIRECLSEEIEEYVNYYHKEVERQIQKENQQREKIKKQIKDVKTDQTNLLNHKKQLESVRLQLNVLGRKEI